MLDKVNRKGTTMTDATKSLLENINMEDLAKTLGITGDIGDGSTSLSDALKALRNFTEEDEDGAKQLAAEAKKAATGKTDVVKELEKRLEKNKYYMPVNAVSELELAMKMLLNRLWNDKELFCIVADGYAITGLSDDSTQITFDKEKINKFKEEKG